MWEERELKTMPFDVYEDGTWYHATGMECKEPVTGEWWNEYINDNGDYIYRR